MKCKNVTFQLVLVDDTWYFQKNENGSIFDEEVVGSYLSDEEAIRCVRNDYCPEDGFEVVKMYGSYNVPPIFDPRAAVMFDYFINQAYHDYRDSIFDIWLDKIKDVINQDKPIQALLEIENLENDEGVDFWDENFTNYDRLVLLQEDKYEIREFAVKDTIRDRIEDILEDTLNELPIYMRNTIELAGMYWNKFKAPDECLTKWTIEEMMGGQLYVPFETLEKYEVVLDETLAQQTIDDFDDVDQDIWKYFMAEVLPEEYFEWPLRKKLNFFDDWRYERLPKIPISEEEISQIKLPLSKKDFLRLDNSDFRNNRGHNKLMLAFLDRWEDDQMTRKQCGYGDL